MKSIFRFVLVAICVVALMNNMATAQDLQEQLSKLGSDVAGGYITPILSGWGADLNSAFYHSADLHDVLGFDVGIKVALARMKDEDKSFTFDLPLNLGYKFTESGKTYFASYSFNNGDYVGNVAGSPRKLSTSTAIGDKQGGVVKSSHARTAYDISNPVNQKTIPVGTEIFEMPGGFNVPAVPLLMPQAAVGLPFGLEVLARYVPTVSAGDAGKFNYMGFGLRYDVDQWIPLFPIDIAVHFMTQKMNFKSKEDKDIFSASGTAYGVEVSKRLLFITLYGGFQIEKATLTLADFLGTDPTTGTQYNVHVDPVVSPNKSRATVGLRLLLLFINVHAEYSLAKTPVAALGVGITLR
jgi:hypothetical protein